MSVAAADYLGKALDIIEKNSKMRQTDWVALRAKALAQAAGAQTPADTYPAIRAALATLNDHHSFFVTPEAASAMMHGAARTVGIKLIDGVIARVYPGTPAERAGVRPGMTLFSVNGTAVSGSDASKTLQQAILKPEVKIEAGFDGKATSFELSPEEAQLLTPPSGKLIDRCAYVEVPEFIGNAKLIAEYARNLQDTIRKLDTASPLGWIIDVRRNSGGNMYPMIAGLGPILGNSTIGYFVDAHSKEPWWYKDGSAGEGSHISASVHPAYVAKTARMPIAVLISDGTMSSGEVVAIAFSGMSNVRFFGEKTNGLTTANEIFPLPDGAELVLADADETDRNGRMYPNGIPADERVASDWRQIGTAADPVVARAIAWIKAEKKNLESGRR